MEKILTDFGVQPILLFAQVVNFLVLLFILKKLLYKPILKVLEERKRKIEESLSNAEEIKRRLEATTEEERKRIVEAGIEGARIIKEASDVSVKLIEEGKKKGEELYQQILDQAVLQVKAEKEKMMLEVKGELSGIIALALEKIMGGAMDKNAQKKLVEESVKTIKS